MQFSQNNMLEDKEIQKDHSCLLLLQSYLWSFHLFSYIRHTFKRLFMKKLNQMDEVTH